MRHGDPAGHACEQLGASPNVTVGKLGAALLVPPGYRKKLAPRLAPALGATLGITPTLVLGWG